MEVFQIQATGFRAIGLLVAALLLYVVLTAPRFSRTCAQLGQSAEVITTDITAREMRRMLRDIHGKSTGDLIADPSMAGRVDQLHVVMTELKCADTIVLGIVCRATYHLGTGDNTGPEQQDFFTLRNSGRPVSWFDWLGPRKLLFNLSWRKCTRS